MIKIHIFKADVETMHGDTGTYWIVSKTFLGFEYQWKRYITFTDAVNSL